LNRPGFVLTEKQRQAVANAFEYRFSIITGPPGTGKTAVAAIINAVAIMAGVEVFEASSGEDEDEDENGYSCFGIALAGRAASNLREAASSYRPGGVVRMTASTIHRALGIRDDADDRTVIANKHLGCGVLIADEMSMNNSLLVRTILKKIAAKHFVFMGDGDQLQPIGAGKPFRDMLASEAIPTVVLNQNFRTECAGIQTLCADILCGEVKTLEHYEKLGGVQFVGGDYSGKALIAAGLYADEIERGSNPHEIAILSPHKNGLSGTPVLNEATQDVLGMPRDAFAKGDLMLVSKNDYHACSLNEKEEETQIFNGERCLVTGGGDDFIDVAFLENLDGATRRVRFLTEDRRDFEKRILPGYAMSVHKAQGSQFRTVIVTTERGYSKGGVVQKSSVYTACSRARDRLIIVGNFDDLAHAAKTPEIARETLLLGLLNPAHALKPPVVPFRPIAKAVEGLRVRTKASGLGTIVKVDPDGEVVAVRLDEGRVARMPRWTLAEEAIEGRVFVADKRVDA
jgi:exodeoxyribonuclease V alpha subunit